VPRYGHLKIQIQRYIIKDINQAGSQVLYLNPTIDKMKNIISILCLIILITSCSESGKSKVDSSTSNGSDLNESSKVTLFLTSSGMEVSSGLIPLLPFKPAGRTVSYITTASVTDSAALEWTNDEIVAIENVGFNVDRIDLSILEPEDLKEAFYGCDLFWVGGGNTLYLLQEVRRSGFDKFVTRKIMEGVPYVGTSAGSILLGPDIEFELYASQAPELNSYEGLNLFPFAPYVHFGAPWVKEVYKEILQFSLDNDKSFITLRDNQFIYVTGEKWQVIDVE
jgi:dipeptidase E